MMEQYETKISKRNLEEMKNRNRTPAEIVEFLENGAVYRSFADVLREVYPGEDLAERLKTELTKMAGKEVSKKEEEALRKNIANWMKGNNVPQSREQLFKLCFALGLSEAASNRVLARASETGIHYRNPEELVYAYALRKELSYAKALELKSKMAQIYEPAVKEAEKQRTKEWKDKEKIYKEKRAAARKKFRENRKKGIWTESYIGLMEEDSVPSFLTEQVIHRFASVDSEEDLRRFFAETSRDLGNMHESAYEKFWKLLLELEEPDDMILSSKDEDSEKYSLERIAEVYFRMNVPVGKKTKNYDYLQKAIKKNWPGASELQKMKSRKLDVSRKALLLLFLITEDFLQSEDLQYSDKASEDAAWYRMEEDETPRDELEMVISKINLFLETYGMNQLDPGNPFDCLFLYALAAEYGDDFLSDNFGKALKELFSPLEEMEEGN